MLREGVQEANARIFIERVLLDKALRGKVGPERAERLQALLDRRTRDILRAIAASDLSWLWYASLIPRRSDQLYAAAADLQRLLGTAESR